MNKSKSPPAPADFLEAAARLASKFGWETRVFERDAEAVLVALVEPDPNFERFIWIYDTERTMLRCLLASQKEVPAGRQSDIVELSARINEGLPFGCAEYSFSDRILVFRDTSDLTWGPVDQIVNDTTSRVINLAQRYASAINAVLDGERPEGAIANVE